MNYLEMVNRVLTRLRERTVSTVNENTYSALIGVLVNDAKDRVETAWDWSGLRTTLELVTEAGTFGYELVDAGRNPSIINFINQDDDFFLEYAENDVFASLFLNQSPASNTPRYYNFNGITDAGNTIVDIYPIPDQAYTLLFNAFVRTPVLENDNDRFKVPEQPIELLAHAYAVEERGEDGGSNSMALMAKADRSMAEYIAIDMDKNPEKQEWRV